VGSRQARQVPVGQPAPVEVEDVAESDPGQQQARDHLGGRDHDVPGGVQPRVPSGPHVAAVCGGAGRRLEVDALGARGRSAVVGGDDEPDRAVPRSRREDDDGGVLETGPEVVDRDAHQGPGPSLSDLDAVDLERHLRAEAGAPHPRDETVLPDVEGVGPTSHEAIIEQPL